MQDVMYQVTKKWTVWYNPLRYARRSVTCVPTRLEAEAIARQMQASVVSSSTVTYEVIEIHKAKEFGSC